MVPAGDNIIQGETVRASFCKVGPVREVLDWLIILKTNEGPITWGKLTAAGTFFYFLSVVCAFCSIIRVVCKVISELRYHTVMNFIHVWRIQFISVSEVLDMNYFLSAINCSCKLILFLFLTLRAVISYFEHYFYLTKTHVFFIPTMIFLSLTFRVVDMLN